MDTANYPELVASKNLLRRGNPLIVAFIAALVAAGSAIIIIGAWQNESDDTDVTLDQPGVYQEPSIATNAPVQGQQLRHADLFDLDEQPLDTSTLFTAGRPVLINYWFSNCQPCKREMPTLEAAFETYGDRVDFVGVNTQDSPEITASFTREIGVTYRILRDPNGLSVVANGISTFPTTLIVNSAGTIIEQIAGELSADDISEAFAKLGVE